MNGGHVVLDTTGMVYDRAFAYFDSVCEKKREERKVVARHEVESLPKNIKSQGFQGDKRVERIRHLLEHAFKDDQGKRIIRSREQRQLHEVYIRTCLPKIYQVRSSFN
jgi:translation elongation factor EF-4